jgi:hypothetical protein
MLPGNHAARLAGDHRAAVEHFDVGQDVQHLSRGIVGRLQRHDVAGWPQRRAALASDPDDPLHVGKATNDLVRLGCG